MVKTYSKRKSGNAKLSANFLVKEFACNDGSDTILIDTELVTLLQKIRNHFGKPVTITSAYRTPSYNAKVGGVRNSYHTQGIAADIVVKGVTPHTVAQYVEYIIPRSGGIGEYGKSKGNFTHVDVRANRSRWQNFGKEVVVSGFPGYTGANESIISSTPEAAKYKIIGTTHVIEIDPRNIWAVETQCSTKKVPYGNFVNSLFFCPGVPAAPVGICVNAGQVLCNTATHGKPVSTLIIHSATDVEVKRTSDITKEGNVWFAVSGYGIYPNITAADEGFTGAFSDVTRATNRPIIGYRKKDNKIVIAVRANSSAERAHETAKNLGLDCAISLDGGGSTTLRVKNKWKFKGDGRNIWGGIIWN